MKRFRIVHTTEYSFTAEAFNIEVVARLRPRNEPGQRCEFFQIVTRPAARVAHLPTDAFGNYSQHLQFEHPLQRVHISAISTVLRHSAAQDAPAGGPAARMDGDQARSPDLTCFLEPTLLVPLSDSIHRYAVQHADRQGTIGFRAEALCRRIHADLTFRAGVTDDRTNAEDVLALRRGVCQDFTHLALACARSMGWASRYVSGYVHTAPFRGKTHRIAADASHAWLEVLDPHSGWLGLDPANNCRTDERYIVAARGRDYSDTCPLEGTFKGGGAHRIRVSVDVQSF